MDVQNITTRTVMTREVMDFLIPTGRNLPGGRHHDSWHVNRRGWRWRAVARSSVARATSAVAPQDAAVRVTRCRPSSLRLNNLCGTGQYAGVYWNEAAQEVYVTGADSAEMGQGWHARQHGA